MKDYGQLVERHRDDIVAVRDFFKTQRGCGDWEMKAADTHIICERLSDGYTVEKLMDAIRGMLLDSHINARNCVRLELALSQNWIDARLKDFQFEEKQRRVLREEQQNRRKREELALKDAPQGSLLEQYIKRMRGVTDDSDE